jgi:DNA-directed RNA polymerase specialized sigma24 family protein
MGEVARLRGTWQAPDETMAQEAGLGFDDFFEPETEQLLRMLTVVTGSAQEAEDIVQDAGGGRPLLT